MADTTDPALENEGADNRDDERPDWLPDNFKSPEDLAKSYQEAQRKITELGQQNRGLEESIQELSAQWDQFVADQNRPDPNAVQEQLLAMYEQNPVATMAQIASETARQVLRETQNTQQTPQTDANVYAYIADQQLSAQYPDWQETKARVAELVQVDPVFQNDQLWTTPAGTTAALERAYKMVKADEYLANRPAQDLQVGRINKLAAQTATGSAGRPDSSPDDNAKRWEEIMNARKGKLDFS